MAGASLSTGLAAMNDRAAAAVPFAQAAALLKELAGIRLTVKRAERAAGASGGAVAAAARGRADRRPEAGPPAPIAAAGQALRGHRRHRRARDLQGDPGREGKGQDGRARTREVKLAVLFTQDKLDKDGYPVRDRDSASVIATFEPAAAFAGLVKAKESGAARTTSASSPSSATAPRGSAIPLSG